jgi:NodT family efflux transporter outer membrane factor (OMF) lipoprotein
MSCYPQRHERSKSEHSNRTITTIRSSEFGMCILSVFFIFGCAVGPDFIRPEPPAVSQYTHETQPISTVPADGQAQHFIQDGEIAADWWRLFNSDKLDTLMKKAVADNQTLQAAQASLRQSQENLRAGYGVFFPQLDASFDAARQKSSLARFGGSSSSNIFNLFTLSATVSYALDVFGGERRAMEGLQAQVDFQHYTVQGTYLTLSGNLVNAVIAQAAYREQAKATEQLIDLIREQAGITEIQAQAGIVPYLNVLSLRSQLAATEATLPPLRQKLSQTEHLLATLEGLTPAEYNSEQIDLTDITLPINLPVTLPSELVHRRPDILAAEAQLHSASADIGVSTAALFPHFTLNGTYGLTNTSLNDLFKNTSSIWNMGATVTAPLFHGGTLWFKRRSAVEGYNRALANYRQTVLSAFAQVADILRALEHDAEAVHAQSQSLSAAEEALTLIQANYDSGTINYLQVLLADNQLHQAKISYLQAQAIRLQDTVALFVAIGGGWWNVEGKDPGS